MKQKTLTMGLHLLCETYSKEMSPTLVAIWMEQFQAMDDEVFAQTCKDVIAREKYFPTPATFREYSGPARRAIVTQEMDRTLPAPSDERHAMNARESRKILEELARKMVM